MTALENRIKNLELTSTPAVQLRVHLTFVCPVRGAVSAGPCGGNRVDRQDDEPEAQFLARVHHLEVAHAQP